MSDKAENKIDQPKEMNIWQLATAVLAVLLVLALFWGITKPGQAPASNTGTPASQNQGTTITAQQAADKTIKYINDYLMQGAGTATLTGVTDNAQFYDVAVGVNGQAVDLYVTKDGKYFVPKNYVYDLDKPVQAPAQTQAKSIPKSDKPEVQLYTMAYCPYGNQAEGVTQPVVKLLSSKVEIVPHFVIYPNYQGGSDAYCMNNGTFCSMHGIQELHEDVRELCIYKYQKDKYWDYVAANDAACTAQNADSCWEAVANSTGIDTAKVKSCYDSEATTLLQNEVALNKKYGVQGSPDLVVNGVSAGNTRSPEGYKTDICSAFNSPPSECSTTLSNAGGTATGGCGT